MVTTYVPVYSYDRIGTVENSYIEFIFVFFLYANKSPLNVPRVV